MHFSCLSLFPEIIQASTEHSITKKALEKSAITISYTQIRDYAINDYGKVDDAIYGGGTGLLLRPEPLAAAVDAARRAYLAESQLVSPMQEDLEIEPACRHQGQKVHGERLIYLSPRGKVLNHVLASELAQEEHLILLCGHYEGVDQRVLEEYAFEEISLGDYVLSGGELAAAVLIDVVMRMVPGVLPEEAWQEDSHSQGFLEEDQYTRPATWRGRDVPPVLLSGHGAKIEEYRKLSALHNTIKMRPDLLKTEVSEVIWRKYLDFIEEDG